MYEYAFEGLDEERLPRYLAGLGLVRVLHGLDQRPGATATWWEGGCLRMVSIIPPDAVMHYLLSMYRPSPVATPWNRGGGFYKGRAALEAVDTIRQSAASRLEPLRSFLEVCDQAVAARGGEPPAREDKSAFLQRLRDRAPDAALPWLDAAMPLGPDNEAHFHALLGTGGNDARIDFGVRYLQMVAAVISPETGEPTERSELQLGALLGGRFAPGANVSAKSGYLGELEGQTNPWAFVLAMEGALVLAGASVVHRLAVEPRGPSRGAWVVEGDEGPVVLGPLWRIPSAWPAIQAEFHQALLVVRRRRAVTLTDAARAFGTAAGASSLFQQAKTWELVARNGHNRVAIPRPTLGRPVVRSRRGAAWPPVGAP